MKVGAVLVKLAFYVSRIGNPSVNPTDSTIVKFFELIVINTF